MKRRSLWWTGLAVLTIVVSMVVGSHWHQSRAAAPSQLFGQAAQPSAETVPDTDSESKLTFSGTYEDPQGTFQIGILEGASVSSAAGSPLFQIDNGNLAYSIVRVPLSSDAPLSEVGLVELAQQTLGQGEGFQTQTFSPVAGGGLQIAWVGQFTQAAATPQPVSGTVLTKQQGTAAYLLVVAALEAAAGDVPGVVSALTDTLVIF